MIIIQRISERAGYMSREDQARLPTRTSRTYKDGFGVKRCVGLKKEMRESQQLSLTKVSFWFHWVHYLILLYLFGEQTKLKKKK